eukprot:UC1_evm1s1737
MNNNALVAIGTGSAKPVTTFTADTKAPTLTRFEVSMDGAGEFVFVFDETMQTSKIDPTKITFVNGAQSLKLTGGSFSKVQADDSTMLKLVPLKADLDKLKLNTELAVSRVTTSITFTKEAFSDMNNQFVNAISVSRTADSFVEDTTKPVLISSSFNLDTSELILEFSEPILASSLSATDVEFRHNGIKVPLTVASTASSVDSLIPVINVHITDMDSIKSVREFVTEKSNTNIAFVGSVTDMRGEIVTINEEHSITTFTPDSQAPVIQSFAIDMDLRKITFTFLEVVDPLTFNVGAINLLTPDNSENYFLTSASSTLQETTPSTVMTVDIGRSDFNAITFKDVRLTSLATSALVKDMAANLVQTVTVDAPMPTSKYTQDASGPVLLSFNFDLSAGKVLLNFEETVRGSTFDASFITLFNANEQVKLTGATTDLSFSGTAIEVVLTKSILDTIKAFPGLAVSQSTTKISFTGDVIGDMFGNVNRAIVDVSAETCAVFTADSVKPEVTSLTLDMNDETVELIFTETVDSTTIDASKLTFAFGGESRTLSSATVLSSVKDTVKIKLSADDKNALDLLALASSRETTALKLFAGAIFDTAPVANPVVEATIPATQYVTDGKSGTLLAFTADIDSGVIVLEFDKVMDASSYSGKHVVLQSRGFSAGDSVDLENSKVTSTNGLFVTIEFDKVLLDEIKRRDDLFTDVNNAFLSVSSLALKDVRSNNINEVAVSSAKQVATIVADKTKPSLNTFDLNMATNVLTLHFSETVDASTINMKLFRFHTTATGAGDTVTLNGGTTLSSDAVTIEVSLLLDDANAMKSKLIGLTAGKTFLSMDQGAIVDMNSLVINPVSVSSAMAVDIFVVDNVSPRLVSFALDADANTITLNFDETVDTVTFSAIKLTLQSAVDGSGESKTLTALSKTSSAPSPTIIVTIATSDMNELKKLEQCATRLDDTFISIEQGLIADRNGNAVVAISPGGAMPASAYTGDTTAPEIDSWSINMDSEYNDVSVGRVVGSVGVTIVFSETIDVSTFNPAALAIQGSVSTGQFVTFSGAAAILTQTDGTTFTFKAKLTDANKIKTDDGIAVDLATSYLACTSALFSDMAGNAIKPVLTSSALRASSFSEDKTAPRLLGFTIDVNAGSMSLIFDETVAGVSFEPVEITIQDAVSDHQEAMQLTGGIGVNGIAWVADPSRSKFDHPDSDQLVLKFTKTDLDELKRLGTCRNQDTCFLVHTEWVIRDKAGNQIIACT